VGDVASRIDLVEQRIAAVATEVARAKTLWPVALRSLEARLDDVASHARHPDASPVPSSAAGAEGEATTADDDLLAGLRDSLQAMETVAAEMARASDVLAPSDETGDTQPTAQEAPEDEPVPHQAVAAGGATILPLRTSDP
jgi:hypothetical protein